MNETRQRKGFILPVAIILVFLVTTLIVALTAGVANAMRTTALYLGRDRCRFAAQSAIEEAKAELKDGFDRYVAINFSSVKIAPKKADVFNWFTVISANRTVGISDPVTLFDGQTFPITVNGCRVWVSVEHAETGSASAVATLVATAVYTPPCGPEAESTIRERVVFGVEQSKVFDNAYFVNNYGWMNGNFTINGEFRANGDVSLKGGAVVNGFVYAAANPEIPNTFGTVTLSSASIKNQSAYRSANTGSSSRARYDTANLDEIGSYNPATASGSISKPTYDAAGRVTAGSMTADGQPIVWDNHQREGLGLSPVDPVPMPFVSDLAAYAEYAREENGTLRYPSVTYTDSTGANRTVPAGTINAAKAITSAGPSGNASLADAGSLLLVGTSSNPIEIDGPVVVPGDVIIKGYVKGQGTIYAGRNIHIIGNITYKDPPGWDHTKSGEQARNEQTANEKKDMLGLVAKGNIVVGDATSSSIASSVNSGDNIAYACDKDDSAIGYPSVEYSSTRTVTTQSRWGGTQTSQETVNTFNGDYTGTEQINGLSSEVAATSPGGYQQSSGRFGKVRMETVQLDTYHQEPVYNNWGWQTGTKNVRDTEKRLCTTYDRHYYETVCDNAIISGLKSSVTQIDAVMYNNHGVFGSLGANFKINGALICRDEGLSANGGTFNWDMRLRRKKDSEIVDKMGFPKGIGSPYVAEWMEVPRSFNSLLASQEESSDD